MVLSFDNSNFDFPLSGYRNSGGGRRKGDLSVKKEIEIENRGKREKIISKLKKNCDKTIFGSLKVP